jgi:hypothetical protein
VCPKLHDFEIFFTQKFRQKYNKNTKIAFETMFEGPFL